VAALGHRAERQIPDLSDPTFAQRAWPSYGIVYAWPLFFYSFFYRPHQVWVAWGLLLLFVIIPLPALFHGKRYCSWVCARFLSSFGRCVAGGDPGQ